MISPRVYPVDGIFINDFDLEVIKDWTAGELVEDYRSWHFCCRLRMYGRKSLSLYGVGAYHIIAFVEAQINL